MSALRDCGYRSLTNPIHVHLKVQTLCVVMLLVL